MTDNKIIGYGINKSFAQCCQVYGFGISTCEYIIDYDAGSGLFIIGIKQGVN